MLALAVQFLTVGVLLGSNGKKLLGPILLAGFLGAGYIVVIKAIPRESGEMQASSQRSYYVLENRHQYDSSPSGLRGRL